MKLDVIDHPITPSRLILRHCPMFQTDLWHSCGQMFYLFYSNYYSQVLVNLWVRLHQPFLVFFFFFLQCLFCWIMNSLKLVIKSNCTSSFLSFLTSITIFLMSNSYTKFYTPLLFYFLPLSLLRTDFYLMRSSKLTICVISHFGNQLSIVFFYFLVHFFHSA